MTDQTAHPVAALPTVSPLVPANKFPSLHLNSRRDLAVNQAEIANRIGGDPALSVLLLINPVLAFKEFGVTVSPQVSNHIMHTLHYLPQVQERHDVLQSSLREALGEEPRPNDPVWLAHTLFHKLDMQPYDTQGQTPSYKTPLDAAAMERLQQLRPQPKMRYPRLRLIPVKSHLSVAPPRPLLPQDWGMPAARPPMSRSRSRSSPEVPCHRRHPPVQPLSDRGGPSTASRRCGSRRKPATILSNLSV